MMKKLKFGDKVSQITSETEFREGLRRQNPPGSCAARNIQDFGGATCMPHGWFVGLVHGLLEVNVGFRHVHERL